MKIVQICVGKFHHFDLARELHARGVLARIHTAYPRWKLRHEGLPAGKIAAFPWVQLPYLAMLRWHRRPRWLERELAYWAQGTLARHVAAHLEACDVLVALSGSGLEAGLEQQRRGGKYVCDRGSCHIQHQDRLLREEHKLWGVEYRGIDPRIMDREVREYAAADVISVPSEFARRSFIGEGVHDAKLTKVPYGVDLRRFGKVGEPMPDVFQILFVGQVSLQKGVPYLLEAFRQFRHPRKKLVVIGSVQPELAPMLATAGAGVQFLGSRPQSELKEWMSRSQVLVLPSIQDGFGMVMAQAMACGCPVIASEHTGAEDLFEDGSEGFIVPIRNTKALVEKLDILADMPVRRSEMSAACMGRVRALGGWQEYGARYLAMLQQLSEKTDL